MKPRSMGALAAASALALTGCSHYARYEARPLDPAAAGAAFEGRSLSDPGLRQFLERNGRTPAAWPLPSWHFEDLCWAAFYYNPSLGVARAQWAAARAGIDVAAARPNPTVSLLPDYATHVAPGISPWLSGLNFDIPVTTAGKRGHQIESEKQNTESARQAVFAGAWQVRAQLQGALIDLDAARRRLGAIQRQAEAQREATRLLQARQAAGSIGAQELAVSRLALSRAEAALGDAKRQVPLQLQQVAQAVGLPASSLGDVQLPVPHPADISSEDLAAARREALLNRPDVLGALARYEGTQASLALEVARQYPDLHLGPGYQYDQGQNDWTLGLTFELPVFQHNQAGIAQAEANRAEAAAEFTALQANVIGEIEGAAATAAASRAQAASLAELQAGLKGQAALVDQRRQQGGADALDVQNSRLEVIAGELGLIDARALAAHDACRLEDALQVPLPSLTNVLSGGPAASSSP
ncbi:MAG TPA: TolC family protein [Opitutaceae bacterium]|nr:TolC family protein [Opitutaceae bacterium]